MIMHFVTLCEYIQRYLADKMSLYNPDDHSNWYFVL
jgi:hypothetical protein